MRYWNIARQRHFRSSARCCWTLRVSVDRAARPSPHTRGKPRLLDVGRRILARDRFAPDSPLEGTGFELPVPPKTPGLWPISTRTTRRDGSRKREFGSDSRLLAPRCGGSGGLGGGLCVPFPTPGDGQQESGLEPIGRHLVRLLRGGVLRTGCFSCSRRGDRVGDPLGKVGSSEFGI